ncbi:hypothetical protein H2201_009162 [Coniosporium apollinis]|uniref:BZIP domain-containing protein n=1 Tax=Coniosporium apollinis TaxID=61459 RepID=A0ABQ9NGW3_9PEZI|nr:hypothetical protein H2201_009162 [Coniosporium apollinis]
MAWSFQPYTVFDNGPSSLSSLRVDQPPDTSFAYNTKHTGRYADDMLQIDSPYPKLQPIVDNLAACPDFTFLPSNHTALGSQHPPSSRERVGSRTENTEAWSGLPPTEFVRGPNHGAWMCHPSPFHPVAAEGPASTWLRHDFQVHPRDDILPLVDDQTLPFENEPVTFERQSWESGVPRRSRTERKRDDIQDEHYVMIAQTRRLPEASKINEVSKISTDADKEEPAKREKFLEKNRMAASRYRQKKKQLADELQNRAREERAKRDFLNAEVSQLREERYALVLRLALHEAHQCSIIHGYASYQGNSAQH